MRAGTSISENSRDDEQRSSSSGGGNTGSSGASQPHSLDAKPNKLMPSCIGDRAHPKPEVIYLLSQHDQESKHSTTHSIPASSSVRLTLHESQSGKQPPRRQHFNIQSRDEEEAPVLQPSQRR